MRVPRPLPMSISDDDGEELSQELNNTEIIILSKNRLVWIRKLMIPKFQKEQISL